MTENQLPNFHSAQNMNVLFANARRFEACEPTALDVERETVDKQSLGVQHKAQRYLEGINGNTSIPDIGAHRTIHPRNTSPRGEGHKTFNLGAEPFHSRQVEPQLHREYLNARSKKTTTVIETGLPVLLADELLLAPKNPVTEAAKPSKPADADIAPVQTTDQTKQNDEEKKKKRILPWVLPPLITIAIVAGISNARGSHKENHDTGSTPTPSALQPNTPESVTPVPGINTAIPSATAPIKALETPIVVPISPTETATVTVTPVLATESTATPVVPQKLPPMGEVGCKDPKRHITCTH